MRVRVLRRFAEEQGLTFLLVFLVVLLFVVYPFFALGRVGQLLVDLFLSLVLLSSAIAVERPRLRKLALWLAVGTVAGRCVFYLRPSGHTVALQLVLAVVYLWVVIGLLLARVFARGRITARRIQGAVAVYLLVGLAFGLVYRLIQIEDPGAFAGGAGGAVEDLTYYSFVTLTTVGYGDISPSSALAKQAAVLEGLIGQLFPAILLARLVSLELVDSSRRGEDVEPD